VNTEVFFRKKPNKVRRKGTYRLQFIEELLGRSLLGSTPAVQVNTTFYEKFGEKTLEL
jgi:hypothetical protein